MTRWLYEGIVPSARSRNQPCHSSEISYLRYPTFLSMVGTTPWLGKEGKIGSPTLASGVPRYQGPRY